MTDYEDDDESCLTRQANESAVLKSIYGDQLVLLSEVGKPLECIIHLWRDSTSVENSVNFPRFDLHVKCPEDYPQSTPYIQLKDWKKIPNSDISALREELLVLADSLKGEVLIHELAGHCENFLYYHDPPETCSFYEGMMQRNRYLEEIRAKELQQKRADEQRKREEMMSHIHSETQAVRKALRRKSKSESVEDDVEKTKSVDRRSTSPEDFSVPTQSAPDADFIEKLINPGPRSSRFQNYFEQIQKIGKGAFGEVWKVRHRLDSGLYAIKKIELNPSKKKLFKNITREVELLSRLNHENVVRYYNSWFESANVDTGLESSSGSMESDTTISYQVSKKNAVDVLPYGRETAMDWSDRLVKPTRNDDSGNWIAFRDPDISGEESSEDEELVSEESSETLKSLLHMYIQMELCEKSTLRLAIDEGLYKNGERIWRLFREIVEGLCHIHKQGIMHRDLKPVNIFLGSNDQVKIGDFGLATTSKSQKTTTAQNLEVTDSSDIIDSPFLSDSSVKDVSHTGHAGTPYYKAPELANDVDRPVYNKKVDIYSLGIIFFEMNYPPINTGMERNSILTNLRSPDVKFPENFHYPEDSYEYKMIKMMLSHVIEERPSSQELLAHDCLATVKLDEGEVKDMVRRTLCNPQSKDYKFLVESCFKQKMPATFEATYNMSTFRSFWSTSYLNFVEEKLRYIFHHYGATSFSPPLLTPGQAPKNSVSLMTNVGGIVHATPDLQMPFARYVVQNPSVVTFKRYTMEKVYREMPAGIHPREVYECAFDIVSSSFGDQMPDIELFAVIKDILKAFPHLTGRNCVIYINHSVLISTLLELCVTNSPTGLKKAALNSAILRIMTETTSKPELTKNLKSINLSESAINIVTNWVELEGLPNDIEDILTVLIKKPDLLSKCKTAIKQLQRVIKDCEFLEMPCPVIIKPPLVQNPLKYTGVLFQVKCDKSMNSKRKGKTTECSVIISGGRYDGLLEQLKQNIPSNDTTKPVRYITGFTLNLEHLVSSLPSVDDDGRPTVVDVLFCSLGPMSMTPERFTLLKEIWGLNVKVYFSNSLQSMEEIQTLCDQLGVTLSLIMKPNDTVVRARLMNKESKSNERKLPYTEVVDYVSKIFKQESTSSPKHVINVPIIQFISTDKITIASKKKQEVQIEENLSTLIQKFSTNVRIEVVVLVQVKGDMIKFLSSVIEPEGVMTCLELAYKRYPNFKKLILKTLKHIEDSRNANPNSVIILYSLSDNTYKLIM
ncbi:hypothetical protein GE061_001624 [Apolygus lucorum]|uniref:non-specific serine/threonine protein kinase n=1 Tax=Apolygus lucorum TaxID=248454 RepID=A0A6A4KK41_APOLU|nr:hypothetical protein GE061_001624 [Apolygus lucorum]